MSTQTSIDSDQLFIGGEWTEPRGSERISVIAASTEELVGSVPEGTNADIDAAVSAARAAFDDPSGWSSWSVEDRAQALERLAGALESRGEESARRVSLQNGMPISIALATEAVFPAVLARYYAGLIRQTTLEEDRQGCSAARSTCSASRWASSARSCRGTTRSASRCSSSRRCSRRAARS